MNPEALYARFRTNVLSGAPGLTADMCAADVVLDLPFAPPGAPRRLAGREAVAAFTAAGRAALPIRFDDFRDVALHRTADPDTLVAEYEITGTTPSGHSATAAFVLVLKSRDGLVSHWREYQDVAGIARELGT
ncbi:nuclear transport factor 2 family protein [Phytomonospora sp. NPDC050363]|uniref:nuclear transport factor 2 family protein n=1 Tax=Phytomonospora sp. NPDC050363 TaxID=3155642 RepID=UPI0033CBBEB7